MNNIGELRLARHAGNFVKRIAGINSERKAERIGDGHILIGAERGARKEITEINRLFFAEYVGEHYLVVFRVQCVNYSETFRPFALEAGSEFHGDGDPFVNLFIYESKRLAVFHIFARSRAVRHELFVHDFREFIARSFAVAVFL